MGADVILSPCSWAVKADHDNNKEPYGTLWENAYAPVARDFAVWIAGCSNVGWMNDGPWKGWKGIGCSLVVDPQGKIALKGPYGEDADTVLYIDIHPVPRPAKGTDWPGYWHKVRN
jgi:predicted amidohydrolase